jgi:hypothetical protein
MSASVRGLLVAALTCVVLGCRENPAGVAVIIDNSRSVTPGDAARQATEVTRLLDSLAPMTRLVLQPLPVPSSASAEALPIVDVTLPGRIDLQRSLAASRAARERRREELRIGLATLRSRPQARTTPLLEAIELAVTRLRSDVDSERTSIVVLTDGWQSSPRLRLTRVRLADTAEAAAAGRRLPLHGVCVVLAGVADEQVREWWTVALRASGARSINVAPQLAWHPGQARDVCARPKNR